MKEHFNNPYRDNGAVGALLDEYERALKDLKNLLKTVTEGELSAIVDTETKDPDCRSIQTILTHVVYSGYRYVMYIRNQQGETVTPPVKALLNSTNDYCTALDKMFEMNVQLFEDYPGLEIEEKDNSRKILVPWGQLFDIEQLLEHAIVHILRHRRQIERFLLKLR